MAGQIPSVSRIVHYVSHGSPVRQDGTQAYTSECRAAIITEVGRPGEPADGGDFVGLCVLNPEGQFFKRAVMFDGGEPDGPGGLCDGYGHDGGTWHWPARV